MPHGGDCAALSGAPVERGEVAGEAHDGVRGLRGDIHRCGRVQSPLVVLKHQAPVPRGHHHDSQARAVDVQSRTRPRGVVLRGEGRVRPARVARDARAHRRQRGQQRGQLRRAVPDDGRGVGRGRPSRADDEEARPRGVGGDAEADHGLGVRGRGGGAPLRRLAVKAYRARLQGVADAGRERVGGSEPVRVVWGRGLGGVRPKTRAEKSRGVGGIVAEDAFGGDPTTAAAAALLSLARWDILRNS